MKCVLVVLLVAFVRFEEISLNVKIGSDVKDWDGASDGSDGSVITASPYFVGVEDATVELCIKIYRRSHMKKNH